MNEDIVATESLNVLFNDDFMRRYTGDNNIDVFFENAGVKIHKKDVSFSQADLKQINAYIRRTTKFKDWNDMFRRASDELNDSRPASPIKSL